MLCFSSSSSFFFLSLKRKLTTLLLSLVVVVVVFFSCRYYFEMMIFFCSYIYTFKTNFKTKKLKCTILCKIYFFYCLICVVVVIYVTVTSILNCKQKYFYIFFLNKSFINSFWFRSETSSRFTTEYNSELNKNVLKCDGSCNYLKIDFYKNVNKNWKKIIFYTS